MLRQIKSERECGWRTVLQEEMAGKMLRWSIWSEKQAAWFGLGFCGKGCSAVSELREFHGKSSWRRGPGCLAWQDNSVVLQCTGVADSSFSSRMVISDFSCMRNKIVAPTDSLPCRILLMMGG